MPTYDQYLHIRHRPSHDLNTYYRMQAPSGEQFDIAAAWGKCGEETADDLRTLNDMLTRFMLFLDETGFHSSKVEPTPLKTKRYEVYVGGGFNHSTGHPEANHRVIVEHPSDEGVVVERFAFDSLPLSDIQTQMLYTQAQMREIADFMRFLAGDEQNPFTNVREVVDVPLP